MIKSMTGYGCAKGSVSDFDVSVELKSVNNRYLETSVRLPRNFMFAEDAVKKTVQKHISRGKVDVFISVDTSKSDDVTVKINEPLLKGYIDAIDRIAKSSSLDNDSTAMSLARMPDVLIIERKDIDSDLVCNGIIEILEEALLDFDKMRCSEGEKLMADIKGRLDVIADYVGIVEKEAPNTVSSYQDKLEKKIRAVLEDRNIDESRLIQEVAIYADHIAVDEETVRLRSHIFQMNKLIMENNPVGRKIDFLVQEFNREANTIGSKCQSSSIAHVVVDMKSEIEKIREQIQNIE